MRYSIGFTFNSDLGFFETLDKVKQILKEFEISKLKFMTSEGGMTIQTMEDRSL